MKISEIYGMVASSLILSSLVFGKTPGELNVTRFMGKDVTPSPACLCVSASGDVFVGVDLNGSLAKKANKGRIIKLVDTDHDGVADKHTVFAVVDNPRGMISFGDKLYVLHSEFSKKSGLAEGVYLSVFTDADGDGVADGPGKKLVKNVSTIKPFRSRGADHATNGIRMGIDGWIYIAVGDFGFVNAEGSDGKKLTMLGGGIVRVRPNGAELEVYTHGLRNIYDVAIDPLMNIYTLGNTNDGGGWNVRFIDQIQTGEYGYPMLFKNFTEEIIPALVDLGGGSATGALFMQEPTWPKKWNNVPMMADWRNNGLFIHRLQPDGASITQRQEKFIDVSQITDVDVDGSGRMYIAAWQGAGYSGSPSRGYVDRVVPKGWEYVPFPVLKELSAQQLVKCLRSASATMRLAAQQELLIRGKSVAPEVIKIARDSSASIESRVAAIFTYAQILETDAIAALTLLTEDNEVREFALRALADRLPHAKKVTAKPFLKGLQDLDPRVQVVAAIGLGRLDRSSSISALLDVAVTPPKMKPSSQKGHQGGPHATPHSAVILPHVAVKALVNLKAVKECLAALDGKSREGALWALKLMHEDAVVDGLIAKFESSSDTVLKQKIVACLGRLYHREAEFTGSFWWGTQPDTRGPYYVPVKWSASEKIDKFFRQLWSKADAPSKKLLVSVANLNRMNLVGIGKQEVIAPAAGKGNNGRLVGTISIEDVMVSLANGKGNKKRGRKIIQRLACAGCHNLLPKDPIKGPALAGLGKHLNKEQIAEAILKPAATIAESWVSVIMKDGSKHDGTLISKNDKLIVVNNLAGISTKLKTSDVKSIKLQETTIMGPGLCDKLTMGEFKDLIEYLYTHK